MQIPETHQDLLKDETRAFASIATVMADGTPQVTIVWFNTDDAHILINTAEGRLKDKNLRARPYVALAIPAPDDSYRYLQIRGPIVGRIYEGADDHISTLSMKYHGKPFQKRAGQIRVIYKILPEKILADIN